MTRAELLNRMSSREITEWMAFGQLEPYGAEAFYLGFAIVAMTVANVNRPKDQKAYRVQDFMPGKKEKQSVAEMIQIAQMMTIGLGGKDKRNKEKE